MSSGKLKSGKSIPKAALSGAGFISFSDVVSPSRPGFNVSGGSESGGGAGENIFKSLSYRVA